MFCLTCFSLSWCWSTSVQCRTFWYSKLYDIAFSALSAKVNLSCTMRYHDCSISSKTGVSWGNKKLIFDVRIKVSGGPVQAKLKMFLGFHPMQPLVRKKVFINSIFQIKTARAIGAWNNPWLDFSWYVICEMLSKRVIIFLLLAFLFSICIVMILLLCFFRWVLFWRQIWNLSILNRRVKGSFHRKQETFFRA